MSKHHLPAVSDQGVVLKRGIRPGGAGAKGGYKNRRKNRGPVVSGRVSSQNVVSDQGVVLGHVPVLGHRGEGYWGW